MTTQYHLRGDISHDRREEVERFCKDNFNFFLFGAEIAKKTKKEHFHVHGKTSESNVRRLRSHWKKAMKLPDGAKFHYCAVARDNIKSMAYCLKDHDVHIQWDNQDEVDEAKKRVEDVQKSQKHGSLKNQCLAYLRSGENANSTGEDIVLHILHWIKANELEAPTNHWMNAIIKTYLMDDITRNAYNLKEIYRLTHFDCSIPKNYTPVSLDSYIFPDDDETESDSECVQIT